MLYILNMVRRSQERTRRNPKLEGEAIMRVVNKLDTSVYMFVFFP